MSRQPRPKHCLYCENPVNARGMCNRHYYFVYAKPIRQIKYQRLQPTAEELIRYENEMKQTVEFRTDEGKLEKFRTDDN